MANLVAVNIKRKDAEVAGHGLSIFLDPKRIKLQDVAEIPEMMEEEKALAEADAGAPQANVHPTMYMHSLVLPTQGQEAAVHDRIVSTESGTKSSEPPFSTDQGTPMDIEEDALQCQPQLQPVQHPRFWSGFF